MTDRPSLPVTTAMRALRAANAPFTPHSYDYVEHGGTRQAARSLGVDEHAVIKTLVFEAEEAGRRWPLIVLMHGDREVSTKQLARHLGAKSVSPATPAAVERHTGYVPGGVSPFGTRARLPVYVEATVLELERVYINGGRRGFLVSLAASDLMRILEPEPVNVATAEHR